MNNYYGILVSLIHADYIDSNAIPGNINYQVLAVLAHYTHMLWTLLTMYVRNIG